MPNYQLITKTTHTGKRWNRYSHYSFAVHDTVVPMVVHELPRVMIHMPIGFIKQQAGFVPVAILELQRG